MKVINYTALKKIEDSISKKPQKKASNPVPEASNSRDIRSVKSVRGGKKLSCRPFRKHEKKQFKN